MYVGMDEQTMDGRTGGHLGERMGTWETSRRVSGGKFTRNTLDLPWDSVLGKAGLRVSLDCFRVPRGLPIRLQNGQHHHDNAGKGKCDPFIPMN